MAILQGKAYYAKIVGEPVKGYNPGEFEWSIDLSLTPEAREIFVRDGFEAKIKNKGDERGDYVTFKRASVKKDGEPAKPIKIVDADKKEWTNGLIGNGSIVNIKYVVNEWTFGKKTGTTPAIIAVQVWEHVPYEGGDREDFDTKGDAGEDSAVW